jgi:hypothetical protein
VPAILPPTSAGPREEQSQRPRLFSRTTRLRGRLRQSTRARLQQFSIPYTDRDLRCAKPAFPASH